MITIPNTAKGLIFDLDGTLANTMQNHFLAWRKAVGPFGINFTPELFLSLTGMPREATITKLNELYHTKMNPVEVGNQKENYFNVLVSETKEIKVVADVVRKFYNVLPLAIGTGSNKKGAETTLETIKMRHYFNVLVTADDIVNPKPNPETFLKCAHLLKVKPSDCLVFEDGILGIEAAKEAGMRVIDINQYFKIEFTY